MLRRRQALVLGGSAVCGVVAAVVTGCAPLKHAQVPSVASGSSPVSGPLVLGAFAPFEYLPSLLSEYHKEHPRITIEPMNSAKSGSERSPFVIEGLFGGYAGAFKARLAPLDGALRTTQWDPASLLPGASDAFASNGQIVGLPLGVQPCVVMWRPDVFGQAGLRPPDPNWTWADFMGACNALQERIASRQLNGVQWALGPMTGQFSVTQAGNILTKWWGASHVPGLWQAFVLGYGGSPVADGRFSLSSAKTKQGLEQFVTAAARFALPASKVPSDPAGMEGFSDRYALAFGFYVPDIGPSGPSWAPSYDKGWQYARLPRFPSRPVVTTSFSGAGLVYVQSSSGSGMDFQQALTQYEADVVDGAAFLTWLYSPRAQAVLTNFGLPPVVGDAGSQRAFWQTMRKDIQTVGDWQNFVYYADGWPSVPPPDIMDGALQRAVEDPSRLSSELSKAEQAMNSWLAPV